MAERGEERKGEGEEREGEGEERKGEVGILSHSLFPEKHSLSNNNYKHLIILTKSFYCVYCFD